jgi:hypothetical protein
VSDADKVHEAVAICTRVLVDQSGTQNRAGLGQKIQERLHLTYRDKLYAYFLQYPDASPQSAFEAILLPSEFPWEGVTNPVHRAGRRVARHTSTDWDFEPAPMPAEVRSQIADALPKYRSRREGR